jgi:hypothetical protein
MNINVNIYYWKIRSSICLKYDNSNRNLYIDFVFSVCTIANNSGNYLAYFEQIWYGIPRNFALRLKLLLAGTSVRFIRF